MSTFAQYNEENRIKAGFVNIIESNVEVGNQHFCDALLENGYTNYYFKAQTTRHENSEL
jgi:hypothetical protein